MKEARAALALARSRLASTEVTSPVDGTVYLLAVRPGNFVNRGDLLARVGDLAQLGVEVYVDEPELGRLARNQNVLITWDAYPGATWKGRVERLPAQVTTLGTRSVGRVNCTIDNSGGRLLPNVNVNVQIITHRSPDTLSVLKEAVIHEEPQPGRSTDQRFVYLIEGGRLRRRQVAVGISNATRTEVRSGLDQGQMVALPTDHKLGDGMRIKLIGERNEE